MQSFKQQFVWKEIDFEFSSAKSLRAINDFEYMSEILLFIGFPSILWTTNYQVQICGDDSFLLSSHNTQTCPLT